MYEMPEELKRKYPTTGTLKFRARKIACMHESEWVFIQYKTTLKSDDKEYS